MKKKMMMMVCNWQGITSKIDGIVQPLDLQSSALANQPRGYLIWSQ